MLKIVNTVFVHYKTIAVSFNDKLEQFKATPVHDWASHGSDAFGEGAININKMQVATNPKPMPKPLKKGWMS